MNRNQEQAKKNLSSTPSSTFLSTLYILGDLTDGTGSSRTISFDGCKLYGEHQASEICPIKIFSEGNVVACIDQHHNAWLICQTFTKPVNVSRMIRRKVKDIFLGEKEMIVKTMKRLILVNWGSKKLIDAKDLLPLSIQSAQNIFEAFLMLNFNENDFFHFSFIKKIGNVNKLYQISEGGVIRAYPSLDRIHLRRNIKGISVGKHHILCWDDVGKLITWGNTGVMPGQHQSDDVLREPQTVGLPCWVICAFASTNYSLALSSDGRIYEWGTKPDVNVINEQLIFNPREFLFRYYRNTRKFILLSGRQQTFGAVSSNGELYVWGQLAKKYVRKDMIYPTEWRGDYLYEPILVTELEHQKVIDFSLQTNFVAVLTVSRTSDYQSSPYLRYWSTLRSKAQSQLFKYKTAKTHRSVLLQDVSKTYKSLQQTSRYSNVSTLCEKQKPSVRYSEQSAIKINTGIFLESTMAWSDQAAFRKQQYIPRVSKFTHRRQSSMKLKVAENTFRPTKFLRIQRGQFPESASKVCPKKYKANCMTNWQSSDI